MNNLTPAQIEALMARIFTPLDCGHQAASRTPISIVGLDLNVFGLEEIKDSTKPVVVLIAAHGRMGHEKTMHNFASGIIGEANKLAESGTRKKDLIVVTLDQRNHGERLKNVQWNLSYEDNPTHFIDMAATVKGGSQDFSLIIDFLGAYLFPKGEKIIDEFMATGISLGGHVTWLCLRDDPRIRVGIPIIGLPYEAFPYYMGPRAVNSGIPFEPPTYPPSIRKLFETPIDSSAYANKKILTLHGSDDPLVPFAQGRAQIEQAQKDASAGTGVVEIFSQSGIGHLCTPEMVVKAAGWVWKWGLSGDDSKM